MNAVAKSPEWSGYDPGTGDQTATTFTFICGDCGRTEHRPTAHLPEGWDRFPLYGDNRDLVRCPDCNEAIEQTKFAELQHRLCDYHERGGMTSIGIHPLKPAQPPGPRPFAIYLERNEGQYLVAMTPEAALMRLSPLGFFLSAEGARTTAWELLKYADLAEAPGTLPNSSGASK